MPPRLLVVLILSILALLSPVLSAAPPLKVGTGIADVTGPTADINFMGYAMAGQVGRGLHFRLRARAFVVQEQSNASQVSLSKWIIRGRVRASRLPSLQ